MQKILAIVFDHLFVSGWGCAYLLPSPHTPLFQTTSDPTLQGHSLLAVNKRGISFLDHVTKVCGVSLSPHLGHVV